MIAYTPEQFERLCRDPRADCDAEHEAIVELLATPPGGDQDVNRCLRSRSRWRRTDAIRRRRRTMPIARYLRRADDRDDPSLAVERAELREQLAAALARLPEGQRAILIARYFDGQCLREIADNLGCTPQSVHAQEKRGLKRLRALLATFGEG